MKRKIVLILLILAILVPTTLVAASRGSVGFINYALLEDYKTGDSAAYVPGLRLEFFFNDYLGISGDAMLLGSWPEIDAFLMMYVLNGVLRAPFGIVEPYVALGPAYFGAIIDGEPHFDEDTFGFNVRAGLDVNILKWLSVGAEFNFFVDDLKEFFTDIGDYFSEQGLNSSLIGISAKIKF